MTTFKLTIEVDNDAFVEHDYPTYTSAGPELARILRRIADQVEGGGIDYTWYQIIRDVNGNDVGTYVMS